MRSLPCQGLLTWLTGKAYHGQKPFGRTPLDHLATALLAILLGVFLSTWAIHFGNLGLLLFVPGWVLTAAGGRKLQVIIMHQCAHNNFSGVRWLDESLGEAISIVLVIRPFPLYQVDHIEHHKAKGLLTWKDETTRFLATMKVETGLPKHQLWKNFWTHLFSPAFHLNFGKTRIQAAFLSPLPLHNLMAASFWGSVLYLVYLLNLWSILLLGWVVPLWFVYQISTCLRLAAEHEWPDLETYVRRDRLFVCRTTKAIFLGEPTPDPSSKFWSRQLSWLIWWFRMLSVHLFFRIFVLHGDIVCHDVHHRNPGDDNWANVIFARQVELEEGCPRWPEPYDERWGLIKAIDHVFDSMSKLPPMEELIGQNLEKENSFSIVYTLHPDSTAEHPPSPMGINDNGKTASGNDTIVLDLILFSTLLILVDLLLRDPKPLAMMIPPPAGSVGEGCH